MCVCVCVVLVELVPHGRGLDVKRPLCLLHYPRKIKFIHSFILSLSLSLSLSLPSLISLMDFCGRKAPCLLTTVKCKATPPEETSSVKACLTIGLHGCHSIIIYNISAASICTIIDMCSLCTSNPSNERKVSMTETTHFDLGRRRRDDLARITFLHRRVAYTGAKFIILTCIRIGQI